MLKIMFCAHLVLSFVNGIYSICYSRSGGKEDDGDGDMELDGTSFIHAMQKMFGG